MNVLKKGSMVVALFGLTAILLAGCGGGGSGPDGGTGLGGGGAAPTVSSPSPANGATVAPGTNGQVLSVYAPGATSGVFYYDDDSVIDYSMNATVSGDYLTVTIPYSSGIMNNAGTNYWYVDASNAYGTTTYPATGSLSFTVSSTGSAPIVSSPSPANGSTVTPGTSGQVISVYAPGATSGTFYYDDDSVIDYSKSATVNGSYLTVTIPYVSGEMSNAGTNYWYVNATNTYGTTRYPSTGSLSFTVSSTSFAPSTWLLNFDWSCNGSDGTTNWHFKSDSTFTSDDGYSGTWSKAGSSITVLYSSGTTYTGTVSGTSMTGTMTANTGSGCWTASWSSNTKPLVVDKVETIPGALNSDGSAGN